MSSIISNATTFLSHYLSYKNVSSDLPQLAKLSITGSSTLSTPSALDSTSQSALMGANKKLFAVVDSITDITSDMTVYLKDSVTAANNKGVVVVPVTAGGSGYTQGTPVTATGGTGSGFAGTLVVDNGVVTGVSISNPGVYTVAPTGFSTSGGTGVTFGAAVMGIAVATIEAHAGVDAAFPFISGASNGFDIVNTWAAGSVAYAVVNGTANVAILVVSLDDSNWLSLGENFNEGVSFTKGVMSTPVARGWNATDHSVRVRSTNQFSIRQLYSSMLEGIAHLRGKTILIKDEVRPDGGSLAKEIHYITGAQFENAAMEVGGGGGGAGVDSVTGSGYFRRMYTWTCDSSILGTAL
jgi:hypothetical protein